MLYTVAEISELLGFSKVTIYNKINSLKNELKDFTVRKQGILHINEDGLLIIKRELNIENGKTEPEPPEIEFKDDFKEFKDFKEMLKTVKTAIESGQNDYVKSLQQQIELLKSELDKKDKQLNDTIRLLENSQVLIREDREKILMLESQSQKRNIFDFFRRKIKC